MNRLGLPRLTLARQLSLLIAGSVVLAVLVVGGLGALNLRKGFREYLQARDDEQLMRLVALIEQHAASDPDFAWMRQDPEPMRALMDEFNGRAPRQRPPRPLEPPGRRGEPAPPLATSATARPRRRRKSGRAATDPRCPRPTPGGPATAPRGATHHPRHQSAGARSGLCRFAGRARARRGGRALFAAPNAPTAVGRAGHHCRRTAGGLGPGRALEPPLAGAAKGYP